jgi:zinc protease
MRAAAQLALAALAAAACGPADRPAPVTPQAAAPPPAPDAAEPAAAPMPWDDSGLDWTAPPEPAAEAPYTPPAARAFTLENGLEVVVVENRRLPLVSLRLVNRRGGALYDPAGLAGLAGLTADLLDEGAGRWTALELADELQRLGARLHTSAGREAATISMETLSATLEPSLAILAAVAATPRLSREDFERVKRDRASAIVLRRDQPVSVAALVLDGILFEGHPYGRPVLGHEATLEAITQQAVRRFYRDHYAPANMVLVVAGDVDTDALRPALEATLGAWRARGGKAPRIAPAPTAPRRDVRLVVVDKPDAPQSVLYLGRVAMTRADERYFAATVIDTALGGSFTSRLNNRLREQLGYTYGARSFFSLGNLTGMWGMRTSLETRHTLDGIREALAIIEGVRTAPLPADELTRTRQLLVRGLPQDFESNAGIAGAFADLALHRLPLDWHQGFAAAVDAVTADAAQAFAQSIWARPDLVMVVVGDLATILDGLLELGLGPALEVDVEGAVVRTHPAR